MSEAAGTAGSRTSSAGRWTGSARDRNGLTRYASHDIFLACVLSCVLRTSVSLRRRRSRSSRYCGFSRLTPAHPLGTPMWRPRARSSALSRRKRARRALRQRRDSPVIRGRRTTTFTMPSSGWRALRPFLMDVRWLIRCAPSMRACVPGGRTTIQFLWLLLLPHAIHGRFTRWT